MYGGLQFAANVAVTGPRWCKVTCSARAPGHHDNFACSVLNSAHGANVSWYPQPNYYIWLHGGLISLASCLGAVASLSRALSVYSL